jgi:CheY-like chemotaxis protein
MAADKKRIVWVEDDKLIAALLAQKLMFAGFDLFCATSGREALQSLNNLQTLLPDIIMVDLLLPDMDGFQILEKIGQDPRLAKIPTMVLSNLNAAADIERAHKLGAKKFLVKATTPLDEIVAAVKELSGMK